MWGTRACAHLHTLRPWNGLQHALKRPLLEWGSRVRAHGLEEPAVRVNAHAARGGVQASCGTCRPPRDHDRQRVCPGNRLAECVECRARLGRQGPCEGLWLSKKVFERPRRSMGDLPPLHAYLRVHRAAQCPIPVEHVDATDRRRPQCPHGGRGVAQRRAHHRGGGPDCLDHIDHTGLLGIRSACTKCRGDCDRVRSLGQWQVGSLRRRPRLKAVQVEKRAPRAPRDRSVLDHDPSNGFQAEWGIVRQWRRGACPEGADAGGRGLAGWNGYCNVRLARADQKWHQLDTWRSVGRNVELCGHALDLHVVGARGHGSYAEGGSSAHRVAAETCHRGRKGYREVICRGEGDSESGLDTEAFVSSSSGWRDCASLHTRCRRARALTHQHAPPQTPHRRPPATRVGSRA